MIYFFPIHLRLTEREVTTIATYCERGGVHAVRWLEERYPFLRHADAALVVRRVKGMNIPVQQNALPPRQLFNRTG